jgi:hypothetical protein
MAFSVLPDGKRQATTTDFCARRGLPPAKPTGSRGLHVPVAAQSGNVDAVLPGHPKNGPAILTADFPVIYGEIDYVPFSTAKDYEIKFLSFILY